MSSKSIVETYILVVSIRITNIPSQENSSNMKNEIFGKNAIKWLIPFTSRPTTCYVGQSEVGRPRTKSVKVDGKLGKIPLYAQNQPEVPTLSANLTHAMKNQTMISCTLGKNCSLNSSSNDITKVQSISKLSGINPTKSEEVTSASRKF